MIDQTVKENLGKALGRIASGVYVVTLERGGTRDGMLCTFIGQVGFEPAMVSIAVKKERPILSSMEPGSGFVLNVLGKNNMDLFKTFAKPFSEGQDRFADLALKNSSNGPILADALSTMECSVKSHTEAGDHVVVLAEVVAGELLNEQEPMIHLRKNGFQY